LIQQGDAVGRLFVASQSGQGKYLCDLLEFAGKGRCSCRDYEIRILPFRERGEVPPKAHCKHLHAAKLYFADEIIQRMITQHASISRGE
jgi:hypothetical protein